MVGRDIFLMQRAGFALFTAAWLAIVLILELCIRTLDLAPSANSHCYHPQRAYTLCPGVVYRTSSGVENRINSVGLDSPEIPRQPRPGERRVLFLGDSVTQNENVVEPHRFPRILERCARSRGADVTVINAGVSGYDTRAEAAFLPELLVAYEPDDVIVVFFLNDAADAIVSTNRLSRGLPESVRRLFFFFADNSNLFRWIRQKIHRAQAPDIVALLGTVEQFSFSEALFESMRALESMILLCRESGASFQVALLPYLHSHDVMAPYYEVVAGRIAATGAPLLDLTDLFADPDIDERTLWVAPTNSHPNAEGNRLMAEELVRQFGLLPTLEETFAACGADRL